MLISYYLVFIFASFKLRADHLSNFNESNAYPQMVPHRSNPLVWGDLSFEIKSEWTILDYLKLYSYCHFLDVVLCLILVTGTLEYDILHLGYLGFALVFFRMRLEILKKKNKIFKFLRMYNFAVIVLSLAYQSPFFGGTVVEKCETIGFIYEVIGFYKYDYGFRITSRSALVEIIIFILVSAQSYIFRLREFDYVSRYLEAEQIDAIWRAKTKKAAWRTAQLQHIRKLEEQKRQRNLQVEKMKAEMLNLQNQLDSINSPGKCSSPCPEVEVGQQKQSLIYQRKVPKAPTEEEQVNKETKLNHDGVSLNRSGYTSKSKISEAENNIPPGRNHIQDLDSSELVSSYSFGDSSFCEITEIDEKNENTIDSSNLREKKKVSNKENPLISAVHLIGDGVSQVQSLGNQAVSNIVSFLNIENDESHSNENAEDVEYGELLAQSHSGIPGHEHLDRTSSNLSSSENILFSTQIGKIFQYIWTKMQANNDAVCFSFFILVFLWNFSVLSMVYLAALFLYALCVNPGPGHAFWVIMLIYTEVNILVQYLYQIIIQHCALNFHPDLLSRLGFPAHRITSSFVVSTLPLFLVYISTLLQSSITAKDGDYASVSGFKDFGRQLLYHDEVFLQYGLMERLKHLASPVMNLLKIVRRSFFGYWRSLIHGSEAPPYFVQLSLKVDVPPEYEIQLDRIESGINKLLKAAHNERCDRKSFGASHSYSHVRVQSIERSPESSDVVLAVFEVMYASPLTECAASDWHTSLTPAADVASEILRAQAIGLVEESGFPYSIISVIAGGKREIDLYAYIFGADMATFFLVAVLYQSAIKNNSKFLDVYQLEDQFPKEFVFVLMVLFFLIVLDRIIYLCSFAVAKVIFYLFNLILFTYSVTEYAWYLELTRQQGGGLALRAIYLTKAVSLVLQALQIRYGIPHKSALYQQFLTSKVSHINYLGFRLYRVLPFLYELRCVLDWSCTSTSLTMYDWLKLEDIYASLYLVKCDADLNRARHQQGQKQTKMTKFCSGICLFFILICVIWAPMLVRGSSCCCQMYSSGNPTNIANPVKDASVQVDIKTTAGRLTLYQTTLCEMLPWEELQASGFELDCQGYLETYNVNDVQLICCQADASSVWSLPHPVQLKFMDSLDDMHIFFSWVLTRDRPRGKEVVQYRNPVEHPPDPLKLKKLLNGTAKSVRINNVYPRYFRVTGSGEVRLFEEDVESVSGDLVLNHGSTQWWSFHDANASVMEEFCRGLKGPSAIVISEETPQGILGETLSKFSIWSLYLTFVLAVGRFIRLQCSDLRMRIPYENLPTCDRQRVVVLSHGLKAICVNIYAARAEGELEVEEVLYWTLVKIYRSPHMLLEYTKRE
ncbi:Piezo-type mechanosensitive ion channel-like protein [Nymphaea thermarum]|nr:Piezo-type mechanosensitive ion channel-like protein [Nymphaea thermarum]